MTGSCRAWAGRLAAIGLLCCVVLTGAWADQMVTHVDAGEVPGSLPSVVSAGTDHLLKHWDTNGKLVATIGAHDDTITASEFVPGIRGDVLITVSADGALKAWNVVDARSLYSVPAHPGGVFALALSPDGRLIATGGADHHIRLWDTLSGHRMEDVKAHGGDVTALAWSLDSKMLVSGSADKMLRVWKLNDLAGQRVRLEYQTNIVAHDDRVQAVALAANDGCIASVSSDGYLKTWRMDGALLHRLRLTNRPVLTLSVSPDGKTLATGDEEGHIRLWNVITGAPLRFSGAHEGAVHALAWSLDGKTLVSGGADKTLRYWNLQTGRQIGRIAAHDGVIRALAVVP